MLDVSVLLFDGFDELDAVGPYETFVAAGERSGAFDASYVTAEVVDTVTGSRGTDIVVDSVIDDPDLLVVPGGGWNDGGGVREAVADGAVPQAIADHSDGGGLVASVCTGAILLAEAGLLDGRPATTHHTATEDLREFTEVRDARVVDTGGVVTAGGITAGIDLSLWLVERFGDRNLAEAVARELEHDRSRDVVEVDETGEGGATI